MKTNRKMLAILMAAVMMMSLLPMGLGHAYLVDQDNCNHDWGEKYYPWNDQYWVQDCKLCGYQRDGADPCKNHQWGEWMENDDGGEIRYCDRCEATQERGNASSGDEWYPNEQPDDNQQQENVQDSNCASGKHSWGSWKRDTDPTCTARGLEYKKCSHCGETTWRYVDMIPHPFGEWYTVKLPAVGAPGLEERECSMCGLIEERETPALESGDLVDMAPGENGMINIENPNNNPTDPDGSENGETNGETNGEANGEGEINGEAALQCSIVLAVAPQNGSYFLPGETAIFSVYFGSRSDDDLINAVVFGQTQDSDVYNSGNVLMKAPFYNGVPMKANEAGSFGFSYTVTEEDATRGAFYAVAAFSASLADGTAVPESVSQVLTIPCGEFDTLEDNNGPVHTQPNTGVEGDEDLKSGWAMFIKEVDSRPQNNEYYVPGEEISYSIALANFTGEELYNIYIYDPMGGGTVLGTASVENGEQALFVCKWTVQDTDAAAGFVTNEMYGEAYTASGKKYTGFFGRTVPAGFPDQDGDGNPDVPFGVISELTVVKEVENQPANGVHYTEGEQVEYKITYTNSGETRFTDVCIYDALYGISEMASAEKLESGESRTCHFTYTVTAADVEAGCIANTAFAQFYQGEYANTAVSNTVIVDTDGQADPDVATPGSAGTIDVEKLRSASGDDFCRRTITDRTASSADFEVAFCSAHAYTQSAALMMAQAASTPETALQSADYSVAMWRSEVEKLYEEILSAADSQAKAVVMTEYVRFLADLNGYEALLNVRYPDAPEKVAGAMSQLWEDKCITLCNEIHASAAQREDNLLSVQASEGENAAECSCEISAEENGKKAYTLAFCQKHGFPFSMIDSLTRGQDTVEGWTALRRIWDVEMSTSYGQLSQEMGENSLLATVEFAALNQWLAAREAMLNALYPENPELVAQCMTKILMERVNLICR